ncbi:MAG TPA: ZIP family metal transporter [Longimicrobiales bacterium]|nr:ZIP family metal transporter [Longimicrobiales bacterium]
MSSSFLVVLAIAGSAAAASVLGGLIAALRGPTTLFMSVALGYASGILLATFAFEMLPQATLLAGLPLAVGGFAAGFAAVYAFDLFVHRGFVAGERSEQRPQVERFYQRRRPRGGEVTVLAGGTSAEELIEGLSIGVGTAIRPGLGVLVALAIAIDNVSEGLSIGEIIRSEPADRRDQVRRILGWTGLIAASLLVSALAGWLALRDLSAAVLGFLFAAGAGGMFYLTVTDLIPGAEEHHYQQSAAIATAAGFLTIFVISSLGG